MIQKIYMINKTNGFWDLLDEIGETYTLAIKIALVHTEISEALLEDEDFYERNAKMEGRAVELIDAMIRVYDVMGYLSATDDPSTFDSEDASEYFSIFGDFAKGIAYLHCQVDIVMEMVRSGEKQDLTIRAIQELSSALRCVFNFYFSDLNLDELLAQKVDYNSNRPYKHNKKF
jgi:hypothetical protein